MKKLFGLFLLTLAFLAPDFAQAATRFWVGGTGTWDSTTTTHWATTSNGAGGASAPVAGDAITFDASSGGGTVTPDSSIDSIAFLSLSAGGFTSGTLAFNTNNPNMAFTSTVNFSGAVTRTINTGSGTWTLSSSATGSIWDITTNTGLTGTFSNTTISLTGNSVSRAFVGGTQTYGAITISNNSALGNVRFQATNTYASITAGSGNTLYMSTTTVTGALTLTGTASAPVGLLSDSPPNATTITVGAASPITWGGVSGVTKAGAGSITATNSFDMGRNTGVSITPPSAGGGGGRIIGG